MSETTRREYEGVSGESTRPSKNTKNVLRDRLREGLPTIGTHVLTSWPGMVEVIGYTGAMHYIEFSAEDAPFDLASLENFARAIDLFDHMTSMMKIEPEPQAWLAGRANGSGIQNLLFADIRSVDDARAAVAAARPETPGSGGTAGAGWKRDTGYGIGTSLEGWVNQRQEGVVALMIEKPGAVESLEEILEIEGVDMVQFGPSDYSVTQGRADNTRNPETERVRQYVNETAIKMGVRPRAEIFHFEEARPYMDMGVVDFCIGWDIRTVYDYCKQQGEELASLLGM
ncbi:MAG: aldolase/citrate lyase family protein [Dehalococcoidia bacterium]|nr:aldolase/citrate lyase family protein [Dehalococcoidia bacterium]